MENRSKRKLFRWTVCFLSLLLIVLQCAFPAQAAGRLEGMHHRLLDPYRNCREEGHLWSEWKQVVLVDYYGNVIQGDCTKGLYQYRTCSACGSTEYRIKEPWAHTFGPWETVRTGTCIQEGLIRHTCVDCGIAEEVSTGYSGHNYGDWVEMQPATCITQGIKYADCRVCGHREYAYTDPVPHSFGEWSVKTAATDFSTGVRHRSCAVCHLEEEEVYYPDGTVFYGDNNNTVYELQAALNRGGYECGTPDGAFGYNTWTAITNFEGDHDLPVDGIGWPGIRRILAEEEQTVRTSRDSEENGPPDDPSKTVSFRNNSTGASLVCSLKEHPAYIPEDRDYYYHSESVVFWVNIENDSLSLIEDVYCYNADTDLKVYYPVQFYPDWKAGEYFYRSQFDAGDSTSFVLFHTVSTAEADAGKCVLRFYASGKDPSGDPVKSEVAELEVKVVNPDGNTSRQTEDPPKEPTIELRESTQAGHWMEDPWDYDGYYYEKGEEIRYKVLVKNDTDDPIDHVVIGYNFTPTKIQPVKLPGQEKELPYKLYPEGKPRINIEVMEAGEHRAFYIWGAAEIASGDKGTMRKSAYLSYTGQGGERKYIFSKPCVVNTGIDPNEGSEK